MKIGNVELSNNIFLAPMAGVTDAPFRKMCEKFGCGLVYSEMVSAKGLYYNDKKTEELMKIYPDKNPCAIQIFGSDAQIMKSVVRKVEEKGCTLIDINMGCPTPKIVNNGDGSALLKNPEAAGKIVKSVKSSATIPVTVKIRSGWDNDSINAVKTAKILEENGADAICVHPRTRQQFYSGTADWNIIKEVKKSVKIPVIGNGDIFKPADAVKMFEYTGCDAVMVARGAQGNPFIFKQIKELIENSFVSVPSNKERIDACIELLKDLVSEKGETRGVKEARKHIAWFIKGMRNSASVKTQVFKMTDVDGICELLNSLI